MCVCVCVCVGVWVCGCVWVCKHVFYHSVCIACTTEPAIVTEGHSFRVQRFDCSAHRQVLISSVVFCLISDSIRSTPWAEGGAGRGWSDLHGQHRQSSGDCTPHHRATL